MLLSQILAGLILGLGYALAAAGLALIFGVMRVVNFAQGEFYMLGALGALLFTTAGLPTPAAVIAAVIVVGLIGALLFRVVIMPVVQDELSGLMITFGVSLILVNGVQWTRGATPEPLPKLISGTVHIFDSAISRQLIMAGAVSVLAIFALAMFLNKSGAGLRIRASADNRIGADVSGVRFSRVQTATFAIGVALAALAGALLGPESFFTADLGQAILAKSFAIVVLGGLGSISGAFWAALALGVLESLAVGYSPSGWQEAISYGLLVAAILVVLFRGELRRVLRRWRHVRRIGSEQLMEAR